MTPEPKRTPPSGTRCPTKALGANWRAAENLHHALLVGDESPAALPGEVWSVRSKSAGGQERLLLAVITAPSSNEQVAVIPLSEDARVATEWDLMIPRKVLGYQVIAQAKLAGSVATEQLAQRLSSLPDAVLGELEELAVAAEEGQSVPPAHLKVGPWVLDEADERLQVRAQDAQRLAAYLCPAFEDPLSEWASFSAIVVRQSTALGVALDEVLEPALASKLEGGRIDLLEQIPPRRIARLLAELQIRWSERVRDGLYRLALDCYRPQQLISGTAFARRGSKRAARPRRARASPGEEDQRAVSEYVAKVQEELGEL
jgi:hypothetical protein